MGYGEEKMIIPQMEETFKKKMHALPGEARRGSTCCPEEFMMVFLSVSIFQLLSWSGSWGWSFTNFKCSLFLTSEVPLRRWTPY